jgi:hypothetical protein
MKKPTASNHGTLASAFHFIIKNAILPALVFILPNQISQAGSATWNLNPTSGDWNTAANWTPPTVPNGPSDTASFDTSNETAVSFSAETEVAPSLLQSTTPRRQQLVAHSLISPTAEQSPWAETPSKPIIKAATGMILP